MEGKTANILVIDDNVALLEMMLIVLEQDGYVVEGAADGAEALMKCQQKDFDLIICDIFMPNQGGIETIDALRKRGDSMPILAISGGGRPSTADYLKQAEDAGANRTLEKPFDLNTISQSVRELLTVDREA